jgi:hypothetical protein
MKHRIVILILFFSTSFAQDYGIGIVCLAEHGPNSGHLQTDSIPIFKQPIATSNTLATFLQIVTDLRGSYKYFMSSSNTTDDGNLVEFDYEEEGIPFDSVNSTQTWARVIYSDVTTRVKGWVQVQAPHTKAFFWRDRLTHASLYFLPSAFPPAFYDKPGGSELVFDIARSSGTAPGDDYIMHAVQADGQWLQVLIVSPSDLCSRPEKPRKKLVWIKYLDETGRPLVFYFARGC